MTKANHPKVKIVYNKYEILQAFGDKGLDYLR